VLSYFVLYVGMRAVECYFAAEAAIVFQLLRQTSTFGFSLIADDSDTPCKLAPYCKSRDFTWCLILICT